MINKLDNVSPLCYNNTINPTKNGAGMQALAEILVYGWIFATAYFIGFILDLF